MKNKVIKYSLTQDHVHMLEVEENEQSIKDAIERFNLKTKSREYLERQLAQSMLISKNISEELKASNKLIKSLLKVTSGIYSKDSKNGLLRMSESAHFRNLAISKSSKSEVGKLKSKIYDQWLIWQIEKDKYKNDADFGKKMFDMFDSLTEARKISEWSIEWRKDKNLPPAA